MPKTSDKINFAYQKEQKEKNASQKFIDWTLSSGKKIIIITEIIVLASLSLRFIATQEANTLREIAQEKQEKIKAQQSFEKVFREKQKKASQVEKILNSRTNWAQKTKKFNENIPQSVILEKIHYTQGKIELSAKVDSAEAFAILITKLRADPNALEVILLTSKYDPELNLYRFSLEINYSIT